MVLNGTAAKKIIDSIETKKPSADMPELEAQLANLVKIDGKINPFLIEELSEKITERDIETTRNKDTSN